MQVVVTGIGLISALGLDLQANWQNLLTGCSGIQPYPSLTHGGRHPLALIGDQPTSVSWITNQVMTAALRDANLAPPLGGCGVVIGSSRGQQAEWEYLAQQFQQRSTPKSVQAADFLHLYSQSSAMAALQKIGAQGPALAPRAACATGLWAIAQGTELIRSGDCQRVIVGAVEAPVTPLTLAGFYKMGALAQTGAYPFDDRREGFVLGEGGAALVLETAELAAARSAKVYGQVLGFGATVDAFHVTTPAPDRRAAVAAVYQCLQGSGLTPQEIDYIHAHGTATQLNDQAEAQLLQTLFPQGVPVSSTKGATGHTLGASGALGAAFTLLALHQGVLPPCGGLTHPAFDLDLIRAARPDSIKTALCFSFGFGGQNTVLALGAKDRSRSCRSLESGQ